MCRMLGQRSVHPETLERLLLETPQCLRTLSHEHKHGWGIALYVGDRPVVVRGTLPAHEDREFEDVGRAVEGDCLLAHIRKASVGSVRLENCHPFHYARWVFMHNGTVRAFDAVRKPLEDLIAPGYLGLIRGDTDSERCFALFLTRLEALGAIELPPVEVIACALAETIALVRELSPDPATALTLLVSDGASMVGVRSGERELCFAHESGRLTIASEPLDHGSWTPMEDGEIVGVGPQLRLRRWRLARTGIAGFASR